MLNTHSIKIGHYNFHTYFCFKVFLWSSMVLVLQVRILFQRKRNLLCDFFHILLLRKLYLATSTPEGLPCKNFSYWPHSLSDISSSDMSDSESPEDSEEVMFTVNEVEVDVTGKITIFFIWLLIETFGNGMLFSLIHFDIFAGDPLKRRISDQVGWFFSILEANVTFFQTHLFSFGQ